MTLIVAESLGCQSMLDMTLDVAGCLSMLKMNLNAAGCIGCLSMLKMTLDAAGCLGCRLKHHDELGCTLMYLDAP